ncbi:MAG: RnfABCDGE type electron transport complex subunit B [Eubacterium sp.]|jgi:Na+-translocating ferredoxin:NAD+ oxidoreductase RNF subunit RnfB|nr:RnfABCDGE type electron transport complex subunit B [Eubacterium sp.]
MEILQQYILPILSFVIMGVVSGVILTVASKVLSVKNDEMVDAVLAELPGINCGACGFSGCEGYAKSVASRESPATFCKPGGEKTVKGISAVLGIAAVAVEKEVAFVHCNGNCDATSAKYAYNGTPSCVAVTKYYNGTSSCRFGCAGLGDCKEVCVYDAISIVNGVAAVDMGKCVACQLCVKKCPNNLITLRKISRSVNVVCSSLDAGKTTASSCKNGCIACKICEKKCPSDSIHVINNIAVIDSEKCTNCGICAESCPKKCIHTFEICPA